MILFWHLFPKIYQRYGTVIPIFSDTVYGTINVTLDGVVIGTLYLERLGDIPP